MAKIWTEEHEEYIRESFRHKTYAELAEHFGVTQKAMESKIRRMGLKKQDYKEPDPMPAVLPTPPMPAEEPKTESGPTPIKSASLLPRRTEEPSETPDEREARLEAEREAAEREKERREHERDGDLGKALKKFEAGLKALHDGALAKARTAFTALVDGASSDAILVARSRQYLATIERRSRRGEFKPDSADDYYLQGVVLLNDGDPSSALDALAKALDMAPGDDKILYCQAAALSQKGDIEQAIDALREAVDVNDANRIYALNDPDFVPMRVHEDFREIVASPEGS